MCLRLEGAETRDEERGRGGSPDSTGPGRAQDGAYITFGGQWKLG